MSYVDLTNPDLFDGETLAVPQQTLNIRRVRAINGRLFERVRVKNYNAHAITLDLEFEFGADFADIFEVRGMAREAHGRIEPPTTGPDWVEFAYGGRDGVSRRTRIGFASPPDEVVAHDGLARAMFRLHLGPYQTRLVGMTVDPLADDDPPSSLEFDVAVHELRRSYEEWERESTQVVTDNELFDQLLARCVRDVRALSTRTEEGTVLAAGIPWYVTLFGRDSLIASHQLL